MVLKQNIQINSFTYQIHLDLNITDRKYKCLINYNIDDNNFIKVHDIYIIDRDIYSELNDSSVDYSNLVFPYNAGFVKDHSKFDNDTINSVNKIAEDVSEEVIESDMIKIYHPHNKTNLKYVVFAYTIINNVSIILLCKESKDLFINAESEFIIDNIIYSEYKYAYIPNIEKLILNDKISIDICGQHLTFKDIFEPSITYIENGNTVRMFNSDLQNFKPELYNSIYNKSVLTHLNPLNVLIYPTETTYDGTILPSLTYIANTESFKHNTSLSLSIELCYDENCMLSVAGRFHYGDISDENEVNELYKTLNNVSANAYIEADKTVSQEYIDDDGTEIPCCLSNNIGIATDINFTLLIYEESFPAEYNNDGKILNNFVININSLFSSWDEMPELLTCQVIFKDLYLGWQIPSNQIRISKEDFKFYIKNIDQTKAYMNITKASNLNLIDKAICYVKNEQQQQSVLAVYKDASTRIVIKPMFYKANLLNVVKIRTGVVQNVGINLEDYIGKVSSFKLIINGYTFTETGRNDVYVIFKVESSKIVNVSGVFDIYDGSDNYITSGNYILF